MAEMAFILVAKVALAVVVALVSIAIGHPLAFVVAALILLYLAITFITVTITGLVSGVSAAWHEGKGDQNE